MGEGKRPQWVQDVNQLIKFTALCKGSNWQLLAELAREPLGEAFLALIVPSATDVIRAYTRPKGLRTGGHLKRIERRGRRILRLEDTSEIIGKRMPGYELLHGRKVPGGAKFLWEIDGLIQRGFWYWLIADVVHDFLIDWSTIPLRSEDCYQHLEEVAIQTGDAEQGNIGGGAPYWPITGTVNAESENIHVPFQGAYDTPSGRWFVGPDQFPTIYGPSPIEHYTDWFSYCGYVAPFSETNDQPSAQLEFTIVVTAFYDPNLFGYKFPRMWVWRPDTGTIFKPEAQGQFPGTAQITRFRVPIAPWK